MIKWCYREIYSPLTEDWIGPAVKESTFNPWYGHYGSLEKVAEGYCFNAADEETGKKREIVDLLAALRAGEKCDVVRLERGSAHQKNRRARPRS